MNTTHGEYTPAELPGPPHPRGVNVTQQGTFGEAAFDSMYRRFKGTEHYEDAKKAFLSPSLNRALVSGVNTWHEQVLAGRISLDDLKTMGYTNLARHRKNTTVILENLTRAKNRMTPEDMKIALVATKTSLMFGLNPPMRVNDENGIRVTMAFANMFKQDAKTLRYHLDIKNAAGMTISNMYKTDPTKALKLTLFIDRFFGALQEYIAVGGLRPYDKHSYPVLYKGNDFIMLMDAGLTPAEAAESLIHGLSPERAIEGRGIPGPLVDGVL